MKAFTTVLYSSMFVGGKLGRVGVLVVCPLVSFVVLKLYCFVRGPAVYLVNKFIVNFTNTNNILRLTISAATRFFPRGGKATASVIVVTSDITGCAVLALTNCVAGATKADTPEVVLLLGVTIAFVKVLLTLFIGVGHKGRT